MALHVICNVLVRDDVPDVFGAKAKNNRAVDGLHGLPVFGEFNGEFLFGISRGDARVRNELTAQVLWFSDVSVTVNDHRLVCEINFTLRRGSRRVNRSDGTTSNTLN